ncbi:hypothetical protein [Micromonospora sp. WMMD812]|uniref:hypothetical protein n=1 Tax=Micromonospora sp. WMMD812 TaxID=3015152 RepID=UPI00248AA7BC|nr:hypothetical protein [Micromonospora sp. WMMD812]WBB65747.1 hypothetical protein O7603_21435 [Micromonospora sp. WMMD812]
MSSGEELGLSRVLVDGRRDELLRQWRRYRGELERARVPSKLEMVGPFDVEDQGDNRVKVTAHVRPIWWGSPTSMAGTEHAWRFETRRSASGWRVWEADLPTWCGVQVRADSCR